MVQESFRISAPGKLMLLGEHAVLHGFLSMVCAVNQRITIKITPQKDDKILIFSDIGEYSSTLGNLTPHPNFKFILTAISRQKENLKTGLRLDIQSDFTPHVGLGSSAAVTAAITAALSLLNNQQLNRKQIFTQGLKTIKEVQGTGSGADLAASIFGGVLAYRHEPQDWIKLSTIFPITVIYSGSKMPTTEVISQVSHRYDQNLKIYNPIYQIMETSVLQAIPAVEKKDWEQLGEILNVNQGLMDAIGVNNKKLSEIVYALREDAGIYGSKISGSGLGDCVVGIGTLKEKFSKYETVPLTISQKGIIVD